MSTWAYDQRMYRQYLESRKVPSLSSSSFIQACANGDEVRVRQLLQEGNTNPQFANNEPLDVALTNGHHHIARILLQDRRVQEDSESLARIAVKHVIDVRAAFRSEV